MKAILINSTLQTVTEVTLNPKDTLGSMYKHLGVDMVEVATELPNQDVVFVDEEGLLKPVAYFFAFEGAHQPFAGNGIVVGGNDEGETVAAKSTLEDIKSKVKFYNTRDLPIFQDDIR